MRKQGLLIYMLLYGMDMFALNTGIISDGLLTITLDTPGTYLFAQNINFSPVATGTGIYITSSDVTLDLMGFSLVQANGVANVCGIIITSGLSNITIRNGSIEDFSWSAINVASGCSQIEIDNITVQDCGTRGIEFIGTTASPIFECEVEDCTFLATCTLSTSDNVITFSNTYDLLFSNCLTATCGSVLATSTLSMVKVVNSFRHQYNNIIVMNNVSQFDLRGFSFSNTQTSIFNNCIVNGMVAKGGGSNCQGFVLESNSIGLTGSSINNTFQNCIVNALTGTSNVDGFFTGSGCYGNGFFNCVAQNSNVTDVAGVISGFRFVNHSFSRLFNCYALTCSAITNNTTATPLYAAHGFTFDNTSNASVEQCTANDIYGKTTGTSGRSVGYFWMNCTGCTAQGNTSSRCSNCYDLLSSQAAGITNNSVIQCMAQKGIAAGYSNFNASSFVSTAPTNLNPAGVNSLTNFGLT